MRVSNLQRFLRTLEAPIEALGLSTTAQKGVGAGLAELADALEPFSDYAIEQLAELVSLAKHYRAEGVLPDWVAAAKPAKRAAQPRAPKTPKLTVDDARAVMNTLMEQCHLMEPAQIESEVARLSALTVADLKLVQKDVLSTVVGKKKDEMLAALLRSVNERRKSRDRIESILPRHSSEPSATAE